MGVGTVTMYTVAWRRRSGSVVYSMDTRASSSGSTSSVLSRPACNSVMRPAFTSKPITRRCRPNATASGSPT